MKTPRIFAVAVAAVAASVVLASGVRAEHGEDSEHEGREHEERKHDRHRRERAEREGARSGGERGASSPAARNPAYAKECGACHLAYPPDLLPAASWTALLGSLDRHFGQDATLDPAVRGELERWLVARAAPGDGEAPLRVTERAWFRREHRRVPAAVVRRPAIGSFANCAACHTTAEAWDFDEDGVKIPRG